MKYLQENIYQVLFNNFLLLEELKVKQIAITSKKIDNCTTYPFSQQINHHAQKIVDAKRCCSININGNNNIMIKTLTQKNSVEISLESINNNGKKNACKERERESCCN